MIIKYEYRIRTEFKKIKNKKQFLKFKLIFISILIILLLLFQIIKHAKKNEKYFCCFCAMGKMENRYSRELISYYMSIGVDKFVIADNNLPNTEKFSDILQDYIKNGTVDILDIIGKSYNSNLYFDIMYQKYKNKCDWLTFFDFDEYLVLHSEEGKTLKLKEFLSNKNFEKCEAIEFNWLMYGDNNLVYYDNRTSLERFTKPDYNNYANRFVKSMVRGHLNKTIYRAYESCHKPDKNVLICDSKGDIPIFNRDSLEPPLYKYAYLIHFNTRTAEEYVQKVKRGYPGNNYPSYEERVDLFFTHNKFTEEKLKVFEKAFNQTFGKYHNQYKNLDLNDIISILNYLLKF